MEKEQMVKLLEANGMRPVLSRKTLHRAYVLLESTAPFSYSKYIQDVDGPEKEQADVREVRVWRKRCHFYDDTRQLFIPASMFKKALDNAAKYRKEKITGQGNKTWMDKFKAGIMVMNNIDLPLTVDEVQGEWIMSEARGKSGGGTRVAKCFPVVPRWSGILEICILDEFISEDTLLEHLQDAGAYVGVGRFRPERAGFNGRFKVLGIRWE